MDNRKSNDSGLVLFGLITLGVTVLVRSFLPKRVMIHWSYPKSYENGFSSEEAFEGWGLYCISTKINGREKLLYIGKAYKSNFYDRLRNHERSWLHKYRGEKYVRFGHFEQPLIVGKSVMHDVESALIMEHQPKHNTMQKKSYSYTHNRIIKSEGYRGMIKRVVKMQEH